MRIVHYISILFFVIVIGVFVYSYSPHYQIIKGETFGTYYNIKIKTNTKNKQLKHLVKQKLSEIDAIMSVFNSESEISRINQAGKKEKIQLSLSMQEVLKVSDKVYKQSKGYFDPTLGKLVDLWGFGPSKSDEPNPEDIKKVLENIGFDKLKFNENFTHLYKENNGLVINLSAIAKGWAVDEIALMLDNLGYENYLVEIGGELKAKGVKNEANDSWVVGINIPKPYKSENILAVSLNDLAVATSGNYRNFYIKNEKVRSHTISFKTGYPVETDVASVSVFHKSCMMADAYATAIVSMGIAEGIKFADKYDLMVLIYDNNLKMHLSSTAKQILQGDVL